MATKRLRRKSNISYGLAPNEAEIIKAESTALIRTSDSLTKSIINVLDSDAPPVERISFTTKPHDYGKYGQFFQHKHNLTPNWVIQQIAIRDSLVSTVVGIRQDHVASFGHPRPNRFEKGYMLEPNTGLINRMSKEERDKFNLQVERAVKLLWTCGHTKGIDDDDNRESFAKFLSLIARDAVTVGRIAVEVIYVNDENEGSGKRFHCFRAVDAGTIYKTIKGQKSIGDDARREAYELLCEVAGERLIPEKYQADEYAWAQVVDGRLEQAFTSDEMKVFNYYPATNVGLNDFPITPIDKAIEAITTHMNIVKQNLLYFTHGRASHGMLVIKSDDITSQAVSQIKQQFNASINSTNNSFRLPVFTHGVEEEITWAPIDNSGKDGEFQQLAEQNSREILAAFNMSPDEVPGYQHLSRGSTSQTLSESNQEFKLTASRDVGIRPLLSKTEDFLNTYILPLIDPDLATKARIRLVGLEAENSEKESIRLQQDSEVHMTYDEILQHVEKEPIGKEWAGDFPLNPTFKEIMYDMFTVGEMLEKFCGRTGASKDPQLQYRPSQWWFNNVQAQQAADQAKQAAQAQQQQLAAQQPGAIPGQEPGMQQESGGDGAPPKDKTEDLARSIDQAHQLMSKSEDNLPANKRKLLQTHQKTLDYFMQGFLKDSKQAINEIVKVADHHTPKHNKK